MIFLLSTLYADPDCEKPMRMRGMLPALESVSPTNARIWFGTVGSGTAEHFTLKLYTNETEVEGSFESSCYIHEGPLDNHCNLVFTPDEPLLANTDYHIHADASSIHLNPSMFVDSYFTTTITESTLDLDPSVLSFQGYQARNITNPNSCKWTNSFQHNFLVEFPSATLFDTLIQVYEKMPDNSEVLVHTLFIPIGATTADFRQVVVPGEEGEHCYFVQHEDIAGNQAEPSNTYCFDPFAVDEPTSEPVEDTGEDTGPTQTNIGDETLQEPKEDTASCNHTPFTELAIYIALLSVFFRKKTKTEI